MNDQINNYNTRSAQSFRPHYAETIPGSFLFTFKVLCLVARQIDLRTVFLWPQAEL